MTGVHSSSRPTSVRSSRVLPWPRSPSSTTSWPASSARSSCGMTVRLEAVQAGPGVAALAQGVEQVLAQLLAQRLLLVAALAELAEGADGGWVVVTRSTLPN